MLWSACHKLSGKFHCNALNAHYSQLPNQYNRSCLSITNGNRCFIFLSWLSTATASGGCNGILTNNNTGAPSVCGEVPQWFLLISIPVVLCDFLPSHIFGFSTSSNLLTCPMNVNVPGGQTQLDVDNAFVVWLSSAEATGGCSGVLTNDNTGAPQAAGGSTTVSFTIITVVHQSLPVVRLHLLSSREISKIQQLIKYIQPCKLPLMPRIVERRSFY